MIYYLYFLFYIFLILFLYLLVLFRVLDYSFIYLPLLLSFIPIFLAAIKDLFNKKISTEFFLVIATIIALMGREEQAITAVLLIMLLAQFFEFLIENRTESALKSLITLIPHKVIVLINNKEVLMPIEQILPEMNILVKTGGRIPVDGIIIDGQAAINESSLTGESIPNEKKVNDKVFAGTFIESGSLVIKVEKVGADTFFGKIKILISQAEESKARVSLLTDRIAHILVPSLLAFILLIWILTYNSRLAVTLLVFGSPLELTLITPLAILAGIAASFRYGILVKGGYSLEQFSKVDTLVFDKTGTLTKGVPEVVEIISLNSKYSNSDILSIAAMAEKRSSHPIARTVLDEAKSKNIIIKDPDEYHYLIGHGIKIKKNNKEYFVGNKKFILETTPYLNKIEDKPCREPHTTFYIASFDEIYGKICVTDRIRPMAYSILKKLHEQGIKKMYLLSGDHQDVVNVLAKKLNIDHAFGNMFPEQKVEMIKDLQKKGKIVGMIGDGVNDAPSIKQADVGIALGAMGMEPAIQAADIVLMTNDLNKILFIHQLSQKVMRIIKQNLIFGFAVIHSIGITLAFVQIINPIQAALFHAIPDILILLNSVKIIRYKKT